MSNAISDVGVKLYLKGTNYGAFLSVKSAPATGAAPEKLDTTTLDLPKTSSILGREGDVDLTFDYNYTETNFALALTAVTGEAEEFLLVYGDGSGVYIKGQAATWIEPVGLNSVVTGKFMIAQEEIEYKTSAEITALLP
jgi:hypothetical protein